ncbi:MAG: type IV pilus twitching motility protein PilT [Armatimonadetes bacterium]|nr:type IV pilus twitching motility protein PilT [Armatimonadota bacterium]
MSAVLNELLSEMVGRNSSDLHLKAGARAVMRVHGDLIRTGEPISEQHLHDILWGILTPVQQKRLEETLELDLSYLVKGLARFRVNMYWQRGKIGAVFRVIPFKIKTIDELGVPQVCKQVCLLPRGLILVTGPTGSGKSTTLAAMINHINENRRQHIMTIEDPIEYVHPDKVSIINQRELSEDTHSFADALKHVLRQNPDTILVGEMRDLETIQLAITAAETGHLVMSTLHTVDAPQTIDRIIDVFSPEQQAQIRTQLAVTLQAVVSQTLLPLKEGHGRVAAFEVMLATPAIRTLIREGKTHQIYLDIQTGHEMGMVTLDNSLLTLCKAGVIDFEHALAKSSNATEFQRRALNQGIATAADYGAH